jgi:hypothetical protein
MPSIIGKKFNRLTAISLNKKKTSQGQYYNCKCDCGKEKVIRESSIKNGEIKSCGCSRAKNLIGQQFGTLTVVCRSEKNNKSGFVYWECSCKCGKIVVARGSHLLSGNIRSCGKCFFVSDITGSLYGKLKVIRQDYADYGHKGVRWICECECGNMKSIRANNLINGHTRSCGCFSKELSKKTCMKKYGVDHPSKNKEIASKTAKSQHNSFLLYHWKTGQELVCVCSYEKVVVEYLNNNTINFRWQPRTFIMPDGRTYRPDLYLFAHKLWVEIKGYFRDDAEEKWNWFNLNHPNSELWNEIKLKELKIL